MAVYVTLTDYTTAAGVPVNPDEVQAIQAIPSNLLPTGGPAGSYVTLENGQRLTVLGTPAAVAVALAGGGGLLRVLALGLFDAAGALQPGAQGIASVARNALGDYTVTLSAVPAGAAVFMLISTDGAFIMSINGPLAGTNQGVLTFNAAGVAADSGAYVIVVGN